MSSLRYSLAENRKNSYKKYLESINYYDNYIQVIRDDVILEMPKGINGEELIKIAKILKPEYDILTKGTGEQEVQKRGALEGYDEKQIKQS